MPYPLSCAKDQDRSSGMSHVSFLARHSPGRTPLSAPLGHSPRNGARSLRFARLSQASFLPPLNHNRVFAVRPSSLNPLGTAQQYARPSRLSVRRCFLTVCTGSFNSSAMAKEVSPPPQASRSAEASTEAQPEGRSRRSPSGCSSAYILSFVLLFIRAAPP